MNRKGWVRSAISASMIALFLPIATSGCFGEFRLTRNVYGWNKSISKDKWGRWLVFLVITIVPVYGIAMFVDALIINSIEFWTGKNPVAADAGTTRVVTGPGGETLTMRLREDGAIDATVLHPSGALDSFRLVRESDAVVAFDAQGHEIARVGDVLGKPGLLAAN